MKTRPLTADQANWFAATSHKPENLNPCVRVFGLGRAGLTCKTCRHLLRKQRSKTYLKCAHRRNTNGPGTDHRAGWPACASFELNPQH